MTKMYRVKLDHVGAGPECWCQDKSPMRIWLATNCDGEYDLLNNDSGAGAVEFEYEEDKFKFILRWV